jgi:hypothetical protein
VLRSFVTLLALLALVSPGARGAAAHHASEDHPKGTFAIPAAGSGSIPIDGVRPGDRLQWTWTVASGNAEKVSAQLAWTASSGAERELSPPTSVPFGTFVAPDEFVAARLIWHNAGDAATEIEWAYAASAPFWRRPDIFLPALIPVLFVIACYAAGKTIDRRARRRRLAVGASASGAESDDAESA